MNNIDALEISEMQPELRHIVKAIAKAVGEDTREYLCGSDLDTNNAVMLLRGDFINTNLRDLVTGENIALRHFKRFVWTGSLLIDTKNRITFTILAKQTLLRIKNAKGRKNPHYLQTMCHVLNGDLKAPCKQMTLADLEGVDGMTPLFSDETYEADFEAITDATLSFDEGYHHCVVTYEAERMEIKSLSLLLLDGDLDVVRDISLMELLQPDFGVLTAPLAEEEKMPREKDAHSLVKVKAGLKSKIANEPKKNTDISARIKEAEKQV